mmetsp:Transcript_40412/g.89772  ORF Transcript_40412/g.89772 Transcript_40412/m.89772 type:complete len:432 (+) Transcript_40412:206-1501(+)
MMFSHSTDAMRVQSTTKDFRALTIAARQRFKGCLSLLLLLCELACAEHPVPHLRTTSRVLLADSATDGNGNGKATDGNGKGKAHDPDAAARAIVRRSQWSWPACPQWILDYAAFHKQALVNPANAKYMLYVCDHETRNYCPGLGDRLRAMQEAFKLAQYTNRTLLFHWSIPAALETIFSPAEIDWRMQKEFGLDKAFNMKYYWGTGFEPIPKEMTDGSFIKVTQDAKLLTVSTNQYDPRGILPGMSLGGIVSNERSCLFNAFFKPSGMLQLKVDEMRRQLFGSSTTPYLAIHLRLGGFAGEWKVIERFNQFQGLMAGLSCAKDLAHAHGLDKMPILLLTDNALLREHVRKGTFSGFITTPFDAGHTSGSSHGAEEVLVTSFVDMALLAQAQCFVGSPSGFSDMALNWGRQSCYINIRRCIETYIKYRRMVQ